MLQLSSNHSPFIKFSTSLVDNYEKLKKKNIVGFRPTLLVTRMVENYFSTLKNFVDHPTIEEYVNVSVKALINFAKEHANDLIFFPLTPKEDVIGSYNRVSGVNISWSTLSEHLKEMKKKYEEKTQTTQIIKLCKILEDCYLSIQLLVKSERRSKTLASTEYTPKVDEITNNIRFLITNCLLLCPAYKCTSTFTYSKALNTHIISAHNLKDDKSISEFVDTNGSIPSKILNIDITPSNGHGKIGTRFLPFQHPKECDPKYPVSANVPSSTFNDLLKILESKSREGKNTLPHVFNTNFNNGIPLENNIGKLIIFADCETCNSNGRPITFFFFCLNYSKSIYIKMKPNSNEEYSARRAGIHHISSDTAFNRHSYTTDEGLRELYSWINEKNTANLPVLIVAHRVATETKALCFSKDFDNDKTIEYLDTLNVLKFSTEETITSPRIPLFDCILEKRVDSLSVDSIANRFGFGPETHNCADDTIFLLGIMIIFYKVLNPFDLATKLLRHQNSTAQKTKPKKNNTKSPKKRPLSTSLEASAKKPPNKRRRKKKNKAI